MEGGQQVRVGEGVGGEWGGGGVRGGRVQAEMKDCVV